MSIMHNDSVFEIDSEHSTGLPDLDAQHLYFYGLVSNATRLGGQQDVVEAETLMLEIARYAQCHFVYEETLMSVYGYPDAQRHIDEHQAILNTMKRAIAGGCVDVGRVKLLMLEWLNTHVPLDDRPMAQFIRQLRPSMK